MVLVTKLMAVFIAWKDGMAERPSANGKYSCSLTAPYTTRMDRNEKTKTERRYTTQRWSPSGSTPTRRRTRRSRAEWSDVSRTRAM